MSYVDKTASFLYNKKLIFQDLNDLAENAKLFYSALNAPMFSAYMSGDQVLTTLHVLPFDTVEFDVGGYFNTSTFQYTPGIAGYYLINLGISIEINHGGLNAAAHTYLYVSKVGQRAEGVKIVETEAAGPDVEWTLSVTTLVFLDGSTAINPTALQTGATKTAKGGQAKSYFQAFRLPTVF